MFMLLALLACFDDAPAPQQGPVLSFVEMPCGMEAKDLREDDYPYRLPVGAVVVSAAECLDVDGVELCTSTKDWVVFGDKVMIDCYETAQEDTVGVIHYLE